MCHLVSHYLNSKTLFLVLVDIILPYYGTVASLGIDCMNNFSKAFTVTEIQGLCCWSFLHLKKILTLKHMQILFALPFFFFKHDTNNTNLASLSMLRATEKSEALRKLILHATYLKFHRVTETWNVIFWEVLLRIRITTLTI